MHISRRFIHSCMPSKNHFLVCRAKFFWKLRQKVPLHWRTKLLEAYSWGSQTRKSLKVQDLGCVACAESFHSELLDFSGNKVRSRVIEVNLHAFVPLTGLLFRIPAAISSKTCSKYFLSNFSHVRALKLIWFLLQTTSPWTWLFWSNCCFRPCWTFYPSFFPHELPWADEIDPGPITCDDVHTASFIACEYCQQVLSKSNALSALRFRQSVRDTPEVDPDKIGIFGRRLEIPPIFFEKPNQTKPNQHQWY